MKWLRRQIQRVHSILYAVRSSLPQKLRDAPEPLVLGGVQSRTAEHDWLQDALGSQLLSGLHHARIIAFAEYDTRAPAGSTFQQLGAKAHDRNRRAKALATTGCTIGLTSPPNLATSRTRLELR
jgi:hypothetical protein